MMRAIYEWCADQGFTPYMQVTVDARTRVPREHIKDGQIVLNIGAEATHQMNIGNEEVTFQARFNGKAFPIYVPVDCVAAIYARENGQGMAFEVELQSGDGSESASAATEVQDAEEIVQPTAELAPSSEEAAAKPRSHLTRIK